MNASQRAARQHADQLASRLGENHPAVQDIRREAATSSADSLRDPQRTCHHRLMDRWMIWQCRLVAAFLQRRNDRGATAVEYALIAGLCVLAFTGGIWALRLAIGGLFDATQTSMDNSVP